MAYLKNVAIAAYISGVILSSYEKSFASQKEIQSKKSQACEAYDIKFKSSLSFNNISMIKETYDQAKHAGCKDLMKIIASEATQKKLLEHKLNEL